MSRNRPSICPKLSLQKWPTEPRIASRIAYPRLPGRLRVTSAVAAPVYLGMAAGAGGAVGSPRVRTVLTGVGAVWLAIGVPVKLASPSLPERALWVPVTATGAVHLWRAVPPEQRRWRGRS